ncbi:MAG: DNA repair protein RecN [Lachnospiraceae bacterium]
MLMQLHVKNLALIEEIEVDFSDQLNILTGETGAGKSIIIGSINAAFGKKIGKDMIRTGADYALCELVFWVKEEETKKKIEELDIPMEEDGTLIVSRKITHGRSIAKINDRTVTLGKLQEVSSMLLDVHGQHEHQSLLQKKKHLEILDYYGKEKIAPIKEKIEALYSSYKELEKKLKEGRLAEEERLREISFIEFEIQDIDGASLQVGEDIQLEKDFMVMSNAKEMAEVLSNCYEETGYDHQGAGNLIGMAIRQITQIEEYDEEISGLHSQLETIEELLNDFNRDLSSYMQKMEFDESDFEQTRQRLEIIDRLKAKYGDSIEKILIYKKEKKKRLEQLKNYEQYILDLESQYKKERNSLFELCEQLTKKRKEIAKVLEKKIKEALIDLNFLDVQFEISFEPLSDITKNGMDDAGFLISTNPGEKLKPLNEVASGGELSRIMLAIKSILADIDEIDTLIFDEIDVGISGRTAQKVSEKMAYIAKRHQVISITHLPQIAAMADTHFLIEKSASNEKTSTSIYALREENSIREIARLISGVEITDTVLKSAKEMKEMAEAVKKD